MALPAKIIFASPDLQANLLVIVLKILLRIGICPADFDDEIIFTHVVCFNTIILECSELAFGKESA
jgi:hypothetical protein